MSSSRNSKAVADGDFETYRQMAPESFSDEKLLNLIKSKDFKRDAIVTAIENVWHDTSDQQAVGSEWITASKITKKDVVKPSIQSTRRSDSGGRGTAKVREFAGGRGGGTDKLKNDKSKPQTSKIVVSTASSTIAENLIVNISKPFETEPSVNNEIGEAGVKSSWGSGPSFAERIKFQELEKVKANLVVESKKCDENLEEVLLIAEGGLNKKSNTPRARSRKSKGPLKKGEDLISNSSAVDIDGIDLTVLQSESSVSLSPLVVPLVSTSSSSTLDSSYLKLGKWDTMSVDPAPPTSTEMFQFGSFGNFSAATSEDETVKTPAGNSTWGASVEESINTVVHDSVNGNDWTDATSNDTSVVPLMASSTIGSIFSHKTGLDSGVRAPPPPGLEQNNSSSQIGSSKAGNVVNSATLRSGGNVGHAKFVSKDVVQNAPILQNQQQLYQQQYSQVLPPGITASVGNRNNLNGPSNLPYAAYSPPFDLTSPAFIHPAYSNGGALSSLSNSAVSSVTPSSVSLPTGSSPSPAVVSQSNVQSQQQQYAAPAPFPFYGNPYYNQAAYYYGQPQVPNYFGQQGNRGLYQQQQQGPYAADPYVNSNSLYQHGGQPQQFAESAPTSYGVSPLHQNMNPVSTNNAVGAGSNSKSTPSKGNVNSGSGQQTNSSQDLNGGNYGYMNPYNPRGLDAQAWQYQQNQAAAAAWGGPMMSFPSAAAVGSGTLHGGFVPQQQQQQPHNGMNVSVPQQSGSGSQRNIPSASTSYGGVSSFVGGRSSGPMSSNGTSGTPQGW